jgi:hypothetical protein
MTHTKIKKMLNDFKNAGGDGLEVVNANSSDEEFLLEINGVKNMICLHQLAQIFMDGQIREFKLVI